MSKDSPVREADSVKPLGAARLISGYAVVTAFLAAAVIASIAIGHSKKPAPAVAGQYVLTPARCLGAGFTLTQSGRYVDLGAPGPAGGKLEISHGRLHGTVTCGDGSHAELDLAVPGTKLRGTLGGAAVTAGFVPASPATAASATPPKKRSGEETFGRLMLAIAAVILAARISGSALGKIGQPKVMGEVLAGILLGPTLLGAVAPSFEHYLFPTDIVPLVSGASQIGLAFYLFLVGMELDPRLLRERIGRATFISNTSVAFPFALGILAAIPLYEVLAPDKRYLPFALFVGVSMSITAFPVLARILVERRMLKRPVGALALASAAIDDVTAWGLLALATAVAGAGSGLHALVVVGLAGVFTAAMILIGRPLLGRVSAAYDEVGHVPSLWLGTIFVSVLLSAYVSQQIGIASIFGAFMMGLIMPRHADLTADVSRRLEDFVVTVLLPLFFVVTGLRTNIGALNRPVLWLLTLGLIAIAIVGKWFGAMAAARYTGFSPRDSAALGALMNTRGLTELIVLNIGFELGLISSALFTMLVLMALVTTFMAGPALRLLDPRGELSEAPEEELRRATVAQPATAMVEGSIIVAPQDDRSIDALLAIAEPLARSQPPREVILARLLAPTRIASGLVGDDRDLQLAVADLNRRRDLLIERQVQSRAVAFTSPDPGADLVRLCSEQDVDLVLLNGRRPLVGEGVPRGDVGRVLDKAPCDVAVLVEREGIPVIDAEHPVIIPFGGADHDWAALELGAWIASARGAPLRLLGAGQNGTDGSRDASRLLGNASLVVQQLAGISAEPLLVNPGADVLAGAAGAGLLVIGLSERWREEGLGPVRSQIAKTAPAPTLFVRRGVRPAALAPKDNMTRFRWSSAGQPAQGGTFGAPSA
jgi:Kef-type K+ transport system membrane component KefB